MGFFDFLRGPDLDAGLQECRADPRALLLDVRTPEEYRAGRIPGSRSLPLQELNGVAALAPARTRRFTSIATAASGPGRPPPCCSAWATPM